MQFLLLPSKKKYIIFSIAVLMSIGIKAAQVSFNEKIEWTLEQNVTRNKVFCPNFISFPLAYYSENTGLLPVWSKALKLNSYVKVLRVSVANAKYEDVNAASIQSEALLKNNSPFLKDEMTVGTEKGRTVVYYSFMPLRYNQQRGVIEKAVSFDILVEYETTPVVSAPLKKAAANSVLATGTWYKLAVIQTGMHKLDRAFFASNKIDLTGVDPRTIKIYGNGAGMLPQLNAASRPDDLVENPIIVTGESDGAFDSTDYIMFYGKSQKDVWRYDGSRYVRENNIYADTTYYFLTFSGASGKRIQKQATAPVPNQTVDQYHYVNFHENDRVNLIKSGRYWWGEEFDKVPQQTVINTTIPSLNTAVPVTVASHVAARAFSGSPSFNVLVNGTNVITHNIGTVAGTFETPYASSDGLKVTTYNATSGTFAVTYKFNAPAVGSTAWLNFFEWNAKAFTTFLAPQALYRYADGRGVGVTGGFTFGGAPGSMRVFDVTDPFNTLELIVTMNAGTGTVSIPFDTTKELLAINNSFFTPLLRGQIANQNLHGLPITDLLLICPPEFIPEANRLALYHQNKLGVRAQVINITDIYNEFSSGAQDISAIRDFLRMLYKRAATDADKPKYVTFVGRASYDYKYRLPSNSNFVPTFQSTESFDPVRSYNSDDYFVFLEDGEGTWNSNADTKESMDVAIGRLPVSNREELNIVIAKIMGYGQPSTQADWRNRMVFVADDQDGNLHQEQSEIISNNAINKFKNYNVEKIYLDAYQEQTLVGGQRNPSAQAAINKAVERGAITVNYTGHGGEVGWAEERVLTVEDINGWKNKDMLTVFITATCEFSRFDDPARNAAGELALLNANGGAIALFTTVRLVTAFGNSVLNQLFYQYAGFDAQGKFTYRPMGDIMMLTKNAYARGDRNERNFTLLGDPLLTISYPKMNVYTTSVNGKSLAAVTDTIRALSKVKVTGKVTDPNQVLLNNFNGEVYATVYDKPTQYRTLGQSAPSSNPPDAPPMDFSMQNSVIYRGRATVKNGLFEFSFIVPKDISYKFDLGKISYYVTDQTIDGNGYDSSIMVGGTSDSAVVDNQGPEIRLYMNDEKFVYGGLTSENPLFIAKLYDENGINTVGKGVGRELLLIIDEDNSKSIPVNDYYQAKLDSYQEGDVKYQLKNLSQGEHTAKLRGWDTYNNSNEVMTKFYVANSEEMALKYVLNYPNPFTTFTTFHFDHNKAGEAMNVMVQIFTISGKLVKTLSAETVSASTHFDQINWDGKDDYGDHLAKGVYIYKVKVKTASGQTADETQKLVILN